MHRFALILAVVAAALLGSPAPAFAHGGEAPDATAYRIEVTGITPAMPGLSLRVVEGGARLELRNTTGRTVEVLGYDGEPYLEVRPDGTFQNVNSPAAYVNETLDGDTPVPAGAGPAVAPRWERVSGDSTVRWHDQRVRWVSADLPPQARADPSREHRIRDWSVPLRDGTREFAATGTLDYLPPPPAWAWWVGTLLLAGAVTAAAARFRLVPPVTAAVGAVVLTAYGLLRAPESGVAIVLFVAAAVGVTAVFWRTPFVTALAGVVLAVFGGIPDQGVFRAAVVAAAGPSWLARVAVLIVIGTGLGLAVNGVFRLRTQPDRGDRVVA